MLITISNNTIESITNLKLLSGINTPNYSYGTLLIIKFVKNSIALI